MKSIEAYQKLVQFNRITFTTADAAGCLKISNAHASKVLERLLKVKQIVRIMKGRWALHDHVDPLCALESVTYPWPSYISLQTALFYHGMIEQIPHIIYAVSLARTHFYKTPLGAFSIHKIMPYFLFGFDLVRSGKSLIRLACPEKALLDIFYLSPAKSGLFHGLPELEFPKQFSQKKAFDMLKHIPTLKRRHLVQKRLEKILQLN